MSLPLQAMAAARLAAGTGAGHDARADRDAAIEFATQFRAWVDDDRWGEGRPADLGLVTRQVAAELAVAEGGGDADDWAWLADDWLECGQVPRAAYARWREAELRIESGDRVGATACWT